MSEDRISGGSDWQDGEEDAVPLHRQRPPILSLSITALFLVMGIVLLVIVREEISYFFEGSSPQIRFAPTPERPLPPDAPSNVVAEIRVDPKMLCDFWDQSKSPFPPEVSYAFTLKMGLGGRYFLTCVGDGTIRPRLWILKPESEAETAAIHQDAVRKRLGRSMMDNWTEEQVPEVHIPGGPGCVNDLCRGRLIRFSEYAANPLGGVRRIQDVLAASLDSELRRTGLPPLTDDDYVLILGETPGSKWWYVLLVGLVLSLSVVNLFFGLGFLRRYLAARRRIEAHLAQVRAKPDRG